MTVTATSGPAGPIPAARTTPYLAQYGGATTLRVITGGTQVTSQIDLDLVQGDTLPSILHQVIAADGSIVDLTNVSSVNFLALDANGDTIINSPGSVSGTPTLGTVTYNFAVADTDEPGLFACRFVIVFNDGSQLSAPQDQPIRLNIEAFGFSP